ncbi:MAG: 23S rRNA (adenine(2503)-C(2))-methyltransferase RlmN [Planctomycetota bacterium]|nr:23S rRNA (adenine(2503)-C(2))-methyltransferase RlmN [Planctomycetota bacterium]MED6307657.1 23S rRNA (adenine(2503)-C(2))-methyltransferase RlmN [Planctomycetota bacterium]
MSSVRPRNRVRNPEAVRILELTCDEFIEEAAGSGISRPKALDAYRALFRRGERTDDWFEVEEMPLTRTQTEGRTIKFTLATDGGEETESVLIPMKRREGGFSRTLCVSSQIGCAMGCGFCETAQMGLVRNLSAGQIVAQWLAARHLLGHEVKNIVFMGMGEPMDNLDQVLQAIRVLTDHNGPSIASGNVTISTVGRIDGIRRLGEFVRTTGFHRLNLAVSVNAPDDEVRSRLMPINRGMDMTALREALLEFPLHGGAALLVEYVLIPGVNDSDRQCDRLCEWLEPLRCSLNVIPYNPRRDSPWSAPDEADVQRFVDRAMEHGQFVKRRGTKGRDVMAACGQLGNPEVRRASRTRSGGTR